VDGGECFSYHDSLKGRSNLARAKSNSNKAEQAKQFLKFEIIGLCLIAIAILGLAASGWVGRSVDYVFIFLGGNLDWLLECLLIYYALYLMIRRQRPRLSSRHWGLILFFLVVLTWSHLNLYDSLTKGNPRIQPDMLDVTIEHIQKQASYNSAVPTVKGIPVPKPSAGGGMVGYGIFSTTHYLFDTAGTLFVLIMGGLISAILVTRKSLVVLMGNARDRVSKRAKSIGQALREWPSLMREKQEKQDKKDKKSKKNKPQAPVAAGAEPQVQTWGAPDETPDHATDTDDIVLAPPPSLDDEQELTIRSFADQLLDEQAVDAADEQGVTTEASPTEPARPTFLANDTGQIKVQFPVEPPSATKEPPKPVAPIKGVPGEAEPVNLVLDPLPEEDELYEIPSLTLLDAPKGGPGKIGVRDVKQNAKKLEQTFESFGVQVKVVNIQIGPTVTQYEVQPAVGVKVSKIVNLADDIALALAAKDIRIEAPIPGKSAVGIEVPNNEVAMVTLREVLETPEFGTNDAKLSVVLGRDISGQPIVGNLAKMPHVLVAGATGSGKSVCVNGIITSILYKAKPSEVKFIMVDPKMVELNVYNGIPHLMAPVVTDPRRAAYALKKVVAEMEHRYELFSKTGVRNMDGYNSMIKEKGGQPLPYIVVIVDELADLMMVAPGDVEDAICRLAQMARAAGIHMIIATQRPSVDVITGVIKANIPSRIAFAVSSQIDSRTILDSGGAEKLLGRGDMLYLPVGASKPTRVQGAFLSDSEVERVVSAVKEQAEARYTVDLSGPAESEAGGGDEELDDLFYDAVRLIVETQQASVSLLQRKLKVGYARAARLVDQMEDRGYVGPFEGSKPREVLVTRDQWHAMQTGASE